MIVCHSAARSGTLREHLVLLVPVSSHDHRAPPVECADHASLAQDFQCSPHGHLGHPVGLGKLKLAWQTTPARELASPDPVGKVVCEFFLLHRRLTPEQLRIEMSRALGAIRTARATASQQTKSDAGSLGSASPVAELAKLAEMLQAGLLTREEFDQLKASLLQK